MQIESYLEQETGCREEQQDYIAWKSLPPHHSLFVLADGMGGHAGGREAGRTVGNEFIAYLTEHLSEENPEELLRQALSRANLALARAVEERPELAGMGTTLIALLLDDRDGTYHYISVGDSPLYLCGNGGLRRINANHAFAEDLKKMVAAGEISREVAQHHPARHAVTSAVTGGDIRLIDLQSGRLAGGQTLLLASDGIQTLDDGPGGEIEALLGAESTSPLAETGRKLLDQVLAKEKPRQDNASLILVRIEGQAEIPATEILTDSRPTQVNLSPPAPNPPAGDAPPKKRLLPVLALGIAIGAAAAASAAAFWWWQQKRHKPPLHPPHIELPKPTRESAPLP
ncbi:MAG: protein phosphatase 2C domain-containing protein [Neisseria sp.]|nr:protein phosphatase 2C domain-containing protein [Neisseria sp.]